MKYYFIEESTFLCEDFYLFIEDVLKNERNVEFILDNTIETTIKNFKQLGQEEKAFAIEGIYEFLNDSNLVTLINTTGYLNFFNLEKYLENKDGKIFLITQKESVFLNCKRMKNLNFKCFYFKDSKLYEWKEKVVEKTEAFYIKNDIYLNKIDTENLKYVFSPKFGYLKLDRNDQRSGGEGTCYPTYQNLYCKIFNKKHITYANLKKLQRMLEIDVFNPSIVWPLDLIYSNDDFVGYVMKQVKDAKNLTELKDDGFAKYSSFKDRTQICISILKSIEYLHSKGIIIGDLKDDNILIKGPDEIYIIDCGSFQIDDYACDVFTRGWTDKKYKVGELDKNLRKLEDEYYPINRLIFEILVLKSPHFSKRNTEIDYEDTQTFDFPLEVDDDTLNKGKYIIPWILLSQRIREYFYYYFNDYKNRRITYIKDWINELEILKSFFEQNNY